MKKPKNGKKNKTKILSTNKTESFQQYVKNLTTKEIKTWQEINYTH